MPILPINQIPLNVAEMDCYVFDLGFAREAQSVGVATTLAPPPTGPMTFSAALDFLNARLENAAAEVLLIMEAPLSMGRTQQGNPCHRNVELKRYYQRGASPRSPKGWYYQAGANLSLGSILFLQAIQIPDHVNVLLAEGFYCSILPDEGHADDQQVASQLLHHALDQPGADLVVPLPERQGGSVVPLPGLAELFGHGVPGVLLRPGLQLNH